MWYSTKENRRKLGGGRKGNTHSTGYFGIFFIPWSPSLHPLPTPHMPLVSLFGQRAPPIFLVTLQFWFLDMTVYCFPMGDSYRSHILGGGQEWVRVTRLVEEVLGGTYKFSGSRKPWEGRSKRPQHKSDIWIPQSRSTGLTVCLTGQWFLLGGPWY